MNSHLRLNREDFHLWRFSLDLVHRTYLLSPDYIKVNLKDGRNALSTVMKLVILCLYVKQFSSVIFNIITNNGKMNCDLMI